MRHDKNASTMSASIQKGKGWVALTKQLFTRQPNPHLSAKLDYLPVMRHDLLSGGAGDLILGIHAVGAHVAELSNQFALALEMGARLEDLANTIHVHPTLGEATMEAAMASLGHAIHT